MASSLLETLAHLKCPLHPDPCFPSQRHFLDNLVKAWSGGPLPLSSPPFVDMGQVLVYPGISSPDWIFPLGLFMKTKNLWDATPTPNHLSQRLHFNNLSFSFQKVRGASGGALPKRRNSKIFLGNVNSCQQFSMCVCVGGWLHMFDWEQLAVYCSTV